LQARAVVYGNLAVQAVVCNASCKGFELPTGRSEGHFLAPRGERCKKPRKVLGHAGLFAPNREYRLLTHERRLLFHTFLIEG
jgi:hypothetical protein